MSAVGVVRVAVFCTAILAAALIVFAESRWPEADGHRAWDVVAVGAAIVAFAAFASALVGSG